MVAVATEPADGNTIADSEFFDARADLGDRASDLVSQSQRPRQSREVTGDEVGVGATDAAGLDADTYFAAVGRPRLDVGELERCARGLDVNCFMGRHGRSLMRDRVFGRGVAVVVDLPVLDAVEPARPQPFGRADRHRSGMASAIALNIRSMVIRARLAPMQ